MRLSDESEGGARLVDIKYCALFFATSVLVRAALNTISLDDRRESAAGRCQSYLPLSASLTSAP